MEFIYIAKSESFPGIVKIGRTDVDVDRRMDQLSAQDYGPSDFQGDSEWDAVRAFVVADNEEAEKLLHKHFSESRVEGRRELFYADDPEELADEAIQLVNGEWLVDGIDAFDVLLGTASLISVTSGISILVHAFFPNKVTDKVLDTKIDLMDKLEKKSETAKTPVAKFLWGAVSVTYGLANFLGMAVAIPFISVVEGWRDIFQSYKKEK